MKKIFYPLLVIAVLFVSVASQSAPASARKDRFANKLHTFSSIVKELQTNYVDTLDPTKIMDRTIEYLLYQIDPYTEYYPADNQDEILSISQGQYAGIGSVIVKRGENVMINDPQEGSPSRRAGLRPGDIILTLDGDSVKNIKELGDVSKRLRGQAGTEVKLTMKRPYVEDSLFEVTIVRDNIKVNPLPYYGVDSDGIGYIRLTTFNESSSKRVREALTEMLRNPQLKGIVLDLRSNGGGLLESAVQIASNFVPKSTEILRTKGRDKRDVKIYKTTSKPLDTEIPLAILIDGNTASSSEIVAGSMQDLDRAVIVGERSFGKGLVQSTRPLPYGDIMKITTGRYYIPSGRLIQALDYSHRDENGNPIRTPDSLTTVFYTSHGREVRDGGGITPDFKVETPESNRLLYNIVSDFWSFDFANKYFAEHPEAPADSIATDEIFEQFKAFIDPVKFKYDRPWESAMDYLRKVAKTEGVLTDSVSAQFDVLSDMLKHDISHDLDLNKAPIKEILDEELASRYYDDATLVKRSLPTDSTYLKAKEILLDRKKLDETLATKK